MIRAAALLTTRSSRLVCRQSFVSASAPPLIATQLDEATGIATVTMQNAPANALSLEMKVQLQALSSSIQSVESNSNMQCLILQSSVPNIFSSGLDLTELHNPNETRLVDFWRAFQDVYLNLYGSRLACIAAMEGHAPAAGCMLALSCDVRIMQDTASYKIGLNESQLGIVAPPWLVQQLVDTVGRRRAELALSLGLLYNPHDALKLQLVDQVVANVRQHAVETANVWRAVPPTARVLSKLLLRKDRLDALRADPQSDIDNFVSIILNKTTQANISAYLQRMAAKKKK